MTFALNLASREMNFFNYYPRELSRLQKFRCVPSFIKYELYTPQDFNLNRVYRHKSYSDVNARGFRIFSNSK
jgi:hypothetical protein